MGKGSRRERQAVNLYQSAGMGTYRPATVQFGENDIMGLFDLLAFSPSHGKIHAVQVKSNKAAGIKQWAKNTGLFRNLGFRTFYLVPYDGEGWRLIECYSTLTKEGECNVERENVVDERDRDVNMGEAITTWLKAERAKAFWLDA